MSKFCEKCGEKLDESTGLCPNCSLSPKKNKKKKKGFVITCIVIVFLLVAIAVTTVVYFNFFSAKDDDKNDATDQSGYVDADKYFEETADVISTINAKDSDVVTSEKETCMILSERGFDISQITSMYDMEGTYVEDKTIDIESDEKHPIYSTYYSTKAGEVWLINVVNNSITAVPLLYNQNSQNDVETIIVESDTIMAYDGPLNKFYEIVPFETTAIVKKVDKIDTEVLENLTAEEIDKL